MLTNWVFITKTSIFTSLHLYIYNFGIILPRKGTSTYRYITYYLHFNTKKDLLYSFLDDSDYGKEETDINAELPL